jgi:hypothetical protein
MAFVSLVGCGLLPAQTKYNDIKNGRLRSDMTGLAPAGTRYSLVQLYGIGIGDGDPDTPIHIFTTDDTAANAIKFEGATGTDVLLYRSGSGELTISGDLDVTGTITGAGFGGGGGGDVTLAGTNVFTGANTFNGAVVLGSTAQVGTAGLTFAGSGASNTRTALSLVPGTNVQAYDAELLAIAGLATTDSNIIVGNGSTWVAETPSTARTSLGLAKGSDVQVWDVNLDQLAALTPTNNYMVLGNGSAWTAAAPAAIQTALALVPGTNVQVYDADLTTIGGLAKTDGNFMVGDGAAWTVESGADARDSLDLGVLDDVEFNTVVARNGVQFGNGQAGVALLLSDNVTAGETFYFPSSDTYGSTLAVTSNTNGTIPTANISDATADAVTNPAKVLKTDADGTLIVGDLIVGGVVGDAETAIVVIGAVGASSGELVLKDIKNGNRDATIIVHDKLAASRTYNAPDADGTLALTSQADGSITPADFTLTTTLGTFEGATADAFETTINVTDPTADRTITFPDISGTVLLSGTINRGSVITVNPDHAGGTDTRTGLSPYDPSHPFSTLQAAVNAAAADDNIVIDAYALSSTGDVAVPDGLNVSISSGVGSTLIYSPITTNNSGSGTVWLHNLSWGVSDTPIQQDGNGTIYVYNCTLRSITTSAFEQTGAAPYLYLYDSVVVSNGAASTVEGVVVLGKGTSINGTIDTTGSGNVIVADGATYNTITAGKTLDDDLLTPGAGGRTYFVGVQTDDIYEATAAAGVDIDGLSIKDGALNGAVIFSGIETIAAAGGSAALSLTKSLHSVDADAGGDIFTLANGTIGQVMTIAMKSSTGTATITPTNLAGGASVTFNAAGDTVILQFVDTEWYILGGNSYTVVP